MMEEMKKYTKMMIDEVQSAEKYITMACKMKADYKDLSSEYKSMAEQELRHKDVLLRTLETLIEDNEEMDSVYDFVAEIISDMVEPIKSKIEAY